MTHPEYIIDDQVIRLRARGMENPDCVFPVGVYHEETNFTLPKTDARPFHVVMRYRNEGFSIYWFDGTEVVATMNLIIHSRHHVDQYAREMLTGDTSKRGEHLCWYHVFSMWSAGKKQNIKYLLDTLEGFDPSSLRKVQWVQSSRGSPSFK